MLLRNDQRGFTLIELAMIIVILGILAAVAIPKYQDLSAEAKEASARSALGGLRSGITIFYANQAVQTGTASWPSYVQIRAIGTVMEQRIPANPYCTDYPDSVIAAGPAVAFGTVQASGEPGWSYKEATGEIWLNTNNVGENLW